MLISEDGWWSSGAGETPITSRLLADEANLKDRIAKYPLGRIGQPEAIRPKPAFRPLFESATTREGSDVVLIN